MRTTQRRLEADVTGSYGKHSDSDRTYSLNTIPTLNNNPLEQEDVDYIPAHDEMCGLAQLWTSDETLDLTAVSNYVLTDTLYKECRPRLTYSSRKLHELQLSPRIAAKLTSQYPSMVYLHPISLS